MVRYRYARAADGSIADAQKLAEVAFDGKEFHCFGCERRLVAKVRGTQVKPHFAHHPGETCNAETYLHRLGKQIFADVYRQCIANGEPFEIELQHPVVCHRFEGHLGTPCVLERTEKKGYDLTNYYNEVLLEKRDGSFIPDLLLFHRDHPDRRVYVEIAVTSFLSQEKQTSDNRIIEIPLDKEEDIERIRSRKLTQETARFVNFIAESQSVTDSDCSCANKETFGFFVYDSGKCFLYTSTLCGVIAKRQKLGEKVKFFRIMDMRRYGDDEEYMPPAGSVFHEAVQRVRAEGFPLKNCYLCRYHAENDFGDSEAPIFCKCFRKTCNSNAAVDCEAFRLPVNPEYAERKVRPK